MQTLLLLSTERTISNQIAKFDRVKVFISHNVVHKKRNKMYINDLVTSQLVQATKITAIMLPTTATLNTSFPSGMMLTCGTKQKPSPIFGRIWWRMTTFDYPSGIQFVIANENDLIDFNAL